MGLLARDVTITLVGGPAERLDLGALSRLIGRAPHRVVHGSLDFRDFLDQLEDVDVVVAADGGTAHLCSLRLPICSVFGSSPWRRYAPFGRDNIVITRDEACSPCVQFSTDWVNGCLTRECTALLRPRQVARVLFSNGIDFSGIGGVRVERGVSHRYVD
jgi:heptosyltransferase-2